MEFRRKEFIYVVQKGLKTSEEAAPSNNWIWDKILDLAAPKGCTTSAQLKLESHRKEKRRNLPIRGEIAVFADC